MKRFILSSFIAAAMPLCATEFKPWFGNVFELEARGKYVFQNFQDVESGFGEQSYVSNDNFATLGLGTNIYGDWNVEIEVTGAQTRAHSFNFDNARVTGRYLFMDDIIGDPVSLTGGLTLIQATSQSLHDLGSFHHGIFEAEIHAAFGREISCGMTWNNRWWVVGAVGQGTVGVPWIRADGVVQFQRFCGNIFEFGIYSLMGTGDRDIELLNEFPGYGLIAHRSIDLGAAYIHRFDISGSLKIEYRRRVYARNFPCNVNYLIVEYLYPFGL